MAPRWGISPSVGNALLTRSVRDCLVRRRRTDERGAGTRAGRAARAGRGRAMTPKNPFVDEAAVANSNYARFDGRHLVNVETGAPASELSGLVHDEIRALVLN